MSTEEYAAQQKYQDAAVAQTYDEVRFSSFKGRLTDRMEKSAVLRALGSVLPEGGLVLDVACGTGRITELLVENNHQFVGIDISMEMLQTARLRLQRFNGFSNLLRSDVARLPFQDNAFNGVVSMRLMVHIPSNLHVPILTEMRRVTKRWLIVGFQDRLCLQYWRRYLFSGFRRRGNPITVGALKREVEHMSLQVVETFPILRGVSETIVVVIEKQ